LHEILIALTVFGLVFLGELPDKTAVATLVLGARYRPLPVWLGVAGAFAVHVVVAVAVGGLIAQLPRTPVELVTGALFLVGAVLLLRSSPASEDEVPEVHGHRVALGAFGAILAAEFGDLTQILTATLAARYDSPVAVGVGAVTALWTVAGIAVLAGRSLLRVVPLRRVQQLAAAVLLVLAVLSLVSALA
jgi:putative Ca2+/H+ antiporter (TMEM165/GDT1 family)